MRSTSVERILKAYRKVVDGQVIAPNRPRCKRYSVSNLQGGVGKSTLTRYVLGAARNQAQLDDLSLKITQEIQE